MTGGPRGTATSCVSDVSIDLESEGIHHIMDLAGENFKGKITDYSARFFGLCEDCLKETEGNSDSSK